MMKALCCDCSNRKMRPELSHTHWARFILSFLFLTLLQDGVWLQLWSKLTASSVFFSSVSVSLFWRATQISFTVSDSPTVLAGSSPDWRRKGGVSGSGLRSSPSWDRERTNHASFTPCCYSCLILSYTCIHTCSGGSGTQCNLLSMFVTPPYS